MFWKPQRHQADNSHSAMTPVNTGNPARAGEKQDRAEMKDSTVTLQLLLVPLAEAPSLKGTCYQLCQPLHPCKLRPWFSGLSGNGCTLKLWLGTVSLALQGPLPTSEGTWECANRRVENAANRCSSFQTASQPSETIRRTARNPSRTFRVPAAAGEGWLLGGLYFQ